MRQPLLVLALWENATLHQAAQAVGFIFFKHVQVIQAAQKDEIGNLFDHLKRVGNTARPKGILDAIDLIADFTGEHDVSPNECASRYEPSARQHPAVNADLDGAY